MKRFLSAVFLILAAAALRADSLNDLNGVVAGDLKVPFYNNERLQAMVFAKSAEYREQLLFGREVFINLLSKNADPDKVAADNGFLIYPLQSPLFKIALFWLANNRCQYSDAVIWTKAAVIDRISRSASGNVGVKMRSPLLDMDGTGFRADFQKRQIRVNKEVKIVLRMTNSDPREFRSDMPQEYRPLYGQGDMLHLDLAENRIMLIGKVRIGNDQVRLQCDRLTVLLGGEKKQSAGDDLNLNAAGVSAIYADGKVRIRKVDKNAASAERQELQCDHLVFDVIKDRITATNDTGCPRIQFGKESFAEGRRMIFFRNARQAILPDSCILQSFDPQAGVRKFRCDYGNLKLDEGICDLLGNVQLNSRTEELNCGKMRVFLKKQPVQTAGEEKKKHDTPPIIGDMKIKVSEIERAVCRENVCMKRTARKGAQQGADDSGTLFCDQLELKLGKNGTKQEFRSAEASGKVRIERMDPDGRTELNAEKGFFDYKANRIDFTGNVYCVKGKSTLKCRKIELFLADRKDSGKEESGIPGLAGAASGSKTLDHIVASGKVRMRDGENELDTERCTLFFAPAKPGDAKKPGFFQSGSLRLVKILCDGGILAKNRKKTEGDMLGSNSGGIRTLKAQHSETDLLRNTTLFQDKVSMSDQDKKLECDKLEFFAEPLASRAKPQRSLDDDPFDLPSENSVPKAIILNDNMQLKTVLATGNVVISHQETGKSSLRQLFCDKATFDGTDMTVVCESVPPKRPHLHAEGKIQTAERYKLWLKEERLDTDGGVEILDPAAVNAE